MDETELGTEIAATLVKRAGTPEDVVRAVLFLVQSPNVTGHTVVVDGGASVARELR
jgi:NAD(P)-dependent dehydrogenase (short-subunit alcohol dehydrogenase family)